jgi:hypothetical protein
MGAKNHGVIMPDANKVRSCVRIRRIRNVLSFLYRNYLDPAPSIYKQIN